MIKRINKFFQPEVPQCVADWYEAHKENLMEDLHKFVYNGGCYEDEIAEAFGSWFCDNEDTAKDTLTKMQLVGYKVKPKEKRYIVEIPNPNYTDQRDFGLYRNRDGSISLEFFESNHWRELDEVKLTEEEIKEDFKWLWGQKFVKEVEE